MVGKRIDLRAIADLSDQWGRGYVPQAPNRHIGDTYVSSLQQFHALTGCAPLP